MFCDWKVFTGLYDAKQRCKERVPLISLIIAPIAIGPASHKAQDAHFTQLILNGTKSQSAQAHQLADIALPWRTAEEQAQHCRAHLRKEHIKHRHFTLHTLERSKLDCFKQSSSIAACRCRRDGRSSAAPAADRDSSTRTAGSRCPDRRSVFSRAGRRPAASPTHSPAAEPRGRW